MTIGRLEEVNVRELWIHEERDFSAWLHANLETLSKAIGIELLEPERETLAGKFQCDIVAVDAIGNRVVIENQLEPTDHDHLGKLLTYVSNLEAKTAIWIATSHRAEHIKSIQWLNEITPDDVAFYMVKLAAYRIEGSEVAAPMFTVVVGPSAEIKSFGEQKKELAERHVQRRRFWDGLLTLAKQQGVQLHAQRSPTTTNWISAGAGAQAGLTFAYLIWMSSGAVELYIDTEDAKQNEAIFGALRAQKAAIESSFGQPLDWDDMPDRRACRVRFELNNGGLKDEDHWPEIQQAMISAMNRLAKAIRPYLGASS
jgi:hypothetical protein